MENSRDYGLIKMRSKKEKGILMIEGKLKVESGAWEIVSEDGKTQPVNPSLPTDVKMFDEWRKCHIAYLKDRVIVDNEAELTAEMMDEMELVFRQ